MFQHSSNKILQLGSLRPTEDQYHLARMQAYTKAYINNIVVFSATLKQLIEHLNAVFCLFVKHNITLNLHKTHLGYFSITLLGQKVNELGLTLAAEKIAAISNWKFSLSLKQLKSYLGFTNWLCNYIPYYAQKINLLQKCKTLLF